jgi:hypothetical protein
MLLLFLVVLLLVLCNMHPSNTVFTRGTKNENLFEKKQSCAEAVTHVQTLNPTFAG